MVVLDLSSFKCGHDAPIYGLIDNPQDFSHDQCDSNTILLGGLTMAHDILISSAFKGLGYRVQAMDCPDYESLRVGKEFGDRG